MLIAYTFVVISDKHAFLHFKFNLQNKQLVWKNGFELGKGLMAKQKIS